MAKKIETKQAVSKPKLSTYASDFTIKFGPLSVRGLLSGVRKSKDSTRPVFHLISPDGNAVEQKYLDTVTKKLHDSDDCDRFYEEAGQITVLDNETLKEIKKSLLPKNIINVTVHPLVDVENQVYPDDNQGYLMYPNTDDPANVEVYGAFVAAVSASTDKAFLGVCNLQGHEGLFRISVWRGRLVFQKQSYPGDLKEHEVVEFKLDNHAKVLRDIFTKRTEPFVAENYRNTVTERQREILADPSKLESTEVTEVKTDISGLLASLADWE